MNITGREDAYETPGKVERKHVWHVGKNMGLESDTPGFLFLFHPLLAL